MYLFTYLRLHRITRIRPGLKTAEDGRDICITILQKDERRTGACMFILSGTVGDDPLVFIQIQTRWVGLDLTQRNVDRARNMT